MTEFRQFLKENVIWGKILCGAVLAIYIGLFLLFSFSSALLPLENQVQDNLLQHGVSRSSGVRVIAITPEDLETAGVSADVLAAQIAEKLNAEEAPGVIALDLPLNGISGETRKMLLRAGQEGNLVYPVEVSVREEDCIRSPLSSDPPVTGAVSRVPAELTAGNSQGHTVRLPDEDGLLRHATFELSLPDGSSQPSMAEQVYLTWCSRTGTEAVLPEDLEGGSILIKFADRDSAELNTCTAGEFLSGETDFSGWKDTIVYIGVFDTRSDAGYRTALDHTSRYHSADVDADITSGLLTGSTAVDAPLWVQALLLTALILLTIFLTIQFHSLFGGFCYILIHELLVQVIAMLVYGVGYNILIFPHMVNGLLTGLLFLGIMFYRRSMYSRRELEKVLGKYVDNRIAGGLISNRLESGEKTENIRQGRTRKVAVLFADIRGFTSISEKIPGETLVRMLNEYLSMMSESVERYGGTVDKFIGDCLMAYWGAPEADEDPVYHACLAAAEIQRRAAESEEKMQGLVGMPVKIGIGISYGDVIVGNIGSADRMNYTVIGDTVNTASRLEGLAPGGQVFLSEEAAGQLDDSGDLVKLPRKFKLKGKEKEVSVYSLNGVSVRGGGKKKETEERRLQSAYRRSAYGAALLNFFVFLIQFVFVVNALRNYGIGFVSYFTIPLAAVSSAVMVMLIPYDLKAAERADGKCQRPGWLNVLMLSALTADLQSMLLLILRTVPLSGGFFYQAGTWPGGVLVYVLCPLLAMFSFLGLERKAEYRRVDALLAEIPLAAALAISGLVVINAGLDQTEPELFRLFYAFPAWLLSVLLELVFSLLLVQANRRLQLQDRFRMGEQGFTGLLHRFCMTSLARYFTEERHRRVLALTVNLGIAVLSLRVTVTAAMAGGVRIYSNPSLTGIIIGISGILAAAVNILAIREQESATRYAFYKYLTFIRNLGCALNFCSVLLLAVSGEGIAAFFTPRWCADVTVFLICPVISMISWLMEKNEYEWWKCVLTSIPYVVLLFLSKAAINTVLNTPGSMDYSYEIANFYQTRVIILISVGEILISGLLYLFNILILRMFREAVREERVVTVSICGSRFGVSGGLMTESEFGLHSECYVVRDGDYGMVISAGSGLELAASYLKGCSCVDVLLGSLDFRDLMGFLAAPTVCQGSKLRIIAPFAMERFSVNPFWPVNLIRKFCVQVPAGKTFRLNDMYSVTFTPADNSGMNYMIRVSGETVICLTGRHPAPETVIRKWCADADMLIYNSCENWSRGCYIAIDNDIPQLLLSGFANALPDSEILATEQKARKLYAEAVAAREGTVFPIHR